MRNKITILKKAKLVKVRLMELVGNYQYSIIGYDDTDEIFTDKPIERIINVLRKDCKLEQKWRDDKSKYYILHITMKHARKIGLVDGNFVIKP